MCELIKNHIEVKEDKITHIINIIYLVVVQWSKQLKMANVTAIYNARLHKLLWKCQKKVSNNVFN